MSDIQQTPEYMVQLRTCCRLVDGEAKFGTAWELTRFNGQGAWETLFTSPDVFEDEEDAKRNAVQKLEPLICCDKSPLRMAFRDAIDRITDEH